MLVFKHFRKSVLELVVAGLHLLALGSLVLYIVTEYCCIAHLLKNQLEALCFS